MLVTTLNSCVDKFKRVLITIQCSVSMPDETIPSRRKVYSHQMKKFGITCKNLKIFIQFWGIFRSEGNFYLDSRLYNMVTSTKYEFNRLFIVNRKLIAYISLAVLLDWALERYDRDPLKRWACVWKMSIALAHHLPTVKKGFLSVTKDPLQVQWDLVNPDA